MNRTSRMTELLGAMRRERNGLVADTMRHYGTPCGLNYGVSLPTVRRIARMQTPDHDFARYLWLQEVRELRLAALHLAEPERVTPEEFAFWAAGLVDSELAAEAAFALLGHIPDFPQLFGVWLVADEPLLRYAALLAASRRSRRCTVRRAMPSGVFATPMRPASWRRVPWRCWPPQGAETKRTDRRYSAQSALWASSLPKTASTRSSHGVCDRTGRTSPDVGAFSPAWRRACRRRRSGRMCRPRS